MLSQILKSGVRKRHTVDRGGPICSVHFIGIILFSAYSALGFSKTESVSKLSWSIVLYMIGPSDDD